MKTLLFLLLFTSFSLQAGAQSFPTSLPTSAPASLFPSSAPAPAVVPSPMAAEDFNYYKRYGKSSKAWNDLVKNGFDSYDTQDCEKAISYFKEALKAGCDDPIMLFKLAACTELLGSYYSAAQYYKQAEDGLKILKAPHRYSTDFYEAYGRTLLLNKKPDEALPYLLKGADLGSNSFTLYYLLGELFIAKKEPATALTYYQKALEQPIANIPPPQLARVYGAIGKAYLENKNWDKAVEYLDLAVKNAPNDTQLQQFRYSASALKRQEEIFKMMFPQVAPSVSIPIPTSLPTSQPQSLPASLPSSQPSSIIPLITPAGPSGK